MNRLSDLLVEFCSQGVKKLEIEKIANYEQPAKYIVDSTNYNDDYETPVLTAGQSFVLGYTDEKNGIYPASKIEPVIIFDDFTAAFKWVDFPFKVKSSAIKIITANDDVAYLRYIYHLMGYLNINSSEHKRLWISSYSQIRVPVPPKAVQREIVRLLDELTVSSHELSSVLNQESLDRKRQYEYYLNRFYEEQPSDLFVPISSLGTLTRGKRFVHSDAVEQGVPCIHYGELYTYYGVHTATVRSHIREDLRPKMRYAKKGDVIIVGAGENNTDIGIGVAWEGEEDVAVHDACYTLSHSQNPLYISYYLRTNFYHKQIKRFVSEGKICSISSDGIGRALIPIPSIEVQNAIVEVLDRFEKLVTDLRDSLSSEINDLNTRFDYYREKVFDFERRS